MANPVAALLVANYKKWPGPRSTPRDWVCEEETCNVYKRPNLYFSETGGAPEKVNAKFTIPPAFAHWEPIDYVDTAEALLNTEHLRLRALNSDKKYLGAKAATRMHPFDAPDDRRPRYNRNPTVACGGDKGLMHEWPSTHTAPTAPPGMSSKNSAAPSSPVAASKCAPASI